MKKILAILIALLAALAVQTVVFADGEVTEIEPTTTVSEDDETTKTLNAQNKDDQGLTYTLNNDGTATVSDCDRTVTSIKIPSNVESNGQTYTVTSIGDHAFTSRYNLASVDIPDSVTSIGDYAFYSCKGLTSVDIPDSVTSIGNDAFSMCFGLTSVDIPDGVTSIGNYAFYFCTSLTSVTIPGSVTEISSYVFDGCSGLTEIIFEGKEPPSFGYNIFNQNLLETVTVTADMTEEQLTAWENSLTKLEINKEKINHTGKIITPDPDPEPEPTPTPGEETPTTPPASNTTATEPTTVQQLEADERPDPQDVEATERYNFWMGVKADLRAAADGKTLRVHVPADYTNMPASVMEQIRLLDADVTVDLRWNGERLTITPETAQRKTALKAFWTFAQLCELYAQ